MKWSELTLKERKQIYDAVRADNPNSSYFDIKEQFDSIPAYEDGGKKKLPNNVQLPPAYTPGTPEYFKRQADISGRVEMVQPEAYLTPAGYVKDAITTAEDVERGDYGSAAVSALMNLIPLGVGKGFKKIKSKVSEYLNAPITVKSASYAEPFAPTITKKRGKLKNKPTEEEEINEVKRQARNRGAYNSEIDKTFDDAIFSDPETFFLTKAVDDAYGTKYRNAYSKMYMGSRRSRNSYLSWGATDKNDYGKVIMRNGKDNQLPTDFEDYQMLLDADTYMPGTANHELGHIADGLAGSTRYVDIDSGKDYITNPYLRFLTDPSNAYSSAELNRMGLNSVAKNRDYLLNPTEAKSHMLTLKRALRQSGDINSWTSTVTEDMVQNYFKRPNANRMIKNQYDLYRNKQSYIDRLNKLTPMEILPPALIPLAGYELNNENQ